MGSDLPLWYYDNTEMDPNSPEFYGKAYDPKNPQKLMYDDVVGLLAQGTVAPTPA